MAKVTERKLVSFDWAVKKLLRSTGGFLARHDEDLREPLVRSQGSQVSMRVARGSASWLSSHGRGLGPRDALKKTLEVFVGGRRETLVSLAFCRGP